jgi:hypothetical protein
VDKPREGDPRCWLVLDPSGAGPADTRESKRIDVRPLFDVPGSQLPSIGEQDLDPVVVQGADAWLCDPEHRAKLRIWMAAFAKRDRYVVVTTEAIWRLATQGDEEARRWASALRHWEPVMYPTADAATFSEEALAAGRQRPRWTLALARECRGTPGLRAIAQRIAGDPDAAALSWSDVLELLLEAARPHHRADWLSCSDEQRIVLMQLAREGVVNRRSRDVVRDLVHRRLVTLEGGPRIRSENLRRFVLEISTLESLARLEQPAAHGGSAIARRMLLSLAVAIVLICWLMIQSGTASLTGVLEGSAAMLAALSGLAGRLREMFEAVAGPAAPRA